MSEPKQRTNPGEAQPEQPTNPNLALYGNTSGNPDPQKEEKQAEHADPERFPGGNAGKA